MSKDAKMSNAFFYNRPNSFKASVLPFVTSFLNVLFKWRPSVFVTLLKATYIWPDLNDFYFSKKKANDSANGKFGKLKISIRQKSI